MKQRSKLPWMPTSNVSQIKPDKKVAEQRELNWVWMRPVTNIKSGKDYML
jgi:hypothetical protein